MNDSDICTTVLLSSWAFYCNSLKSRHSVCEQPMKKSLSIFEDCMKNVHSISSENWWGDWVNESECWTVHSYIPQL